MATAAKAKKPGTKMTVWQQSMKEAAKKVVKNVVIGGGNYSTIGTQGGLSIDEVACKDNELRLVILMHVYENKFYEGAYDPDVKSIPVCYAYATENEEVESMHPHEDSSDPQNDMCAGCPMNEYGSAETGRGKACKNIMKLACVSEGDMESAEALEAAEIRMLSVPVTSVKGCGNYILSLEKDHDLPPYGVVTLVKWVADKKTQFKLQFGFESMLDGDQALLTVLEKRREQLLKDMVLPYQEPIEDEKPAPRRGAKKAPAKKPVAKAAKKPAAKPRKF